MDIRWLRGTEDLTEAYRIRREVFIIEQKVPEEEEWDEYDQVADHILIYDNGRAVGTGRLAIIDGQYTPGRIAILEEFRGRNLGKILVENLMKKAAEKGAKEIHIHAQTYAIGFYERLGFETYGDVYMEAGIEHISMKSRLSNGVLVRD